MVRLNTLVCLLHSCFSLRLTIGLLKAPPRPPDSAISWSATLSFGQVFAAIWLRLRHMTSIQPHLMVFVRGRLSWRLLVSCPLNELRDSKDGEGHERWLKVGTKEPMRGKDAVR